MVETVVKIGGVTVLDTTSNSFVVDNYRATMSDGTDDDFATILVKDSISDLVDVSVVQSVEISRGPTTGLETVIYKGEIKNRVWKAGLIELQCKGMYDILGDTLVSTIYTVDTAEAGEISAIAEDIITDKGYTASVQATGTGATQLLKKFVCNNETAKDRLEVLASLVNFKIWYDAENVQFVFKPASTVIFGTNLVVGGNCSIPLWNDDYSNFMTRITLEGDVYTADTNETFSGTGSQTEFTLSYVPENIKIVIAGVEQVFSIDGAEATYDYTVDKENKKIIFQSGSIPASGTDNIIVDYGYLTKVNITNINSFAEATYNKIREVKFNVKDLKEITDGELKLIALDAEFSSPKTYTDLEVYNVPGLKPGMLVPIIDSISGRNETLPLRKIEYRYPEYVDKIDVGEYETDVQDILRTVEEKIRDINSEPVDNTIVFTLVSSEDLMDIEERDIIIETAPPISATAYWNVTDWNDVTDLWGDGTAETFTQVSVNQGIAELNYERYNELFYDTEYNSGSSTGTWNTSTKQFELDNTEFIQSESIFLGENVASVAIKTTETASVTWELSNDGGSTWESVTVTADQFNVHTFASSATGDVRYKVTATANTQTVTLLQIEKRS